MKKVSTLLKGSLALMAIAVAFAGVSPVAAKEATSGTQYASYAAPEDRLDVKMAVKKINAIRYGKGLSKVRIDPALMQAARVHALDLARIDDVSHYGTDGSDPEQRVSKAGYSGVMTGENVSAGQRDIDEVLDGWLKSKSHRKTLLMKDARHMGVALAYDPQTKYRTFWTLVLAEPF